MAAPGVSSILISVLPLQVLCGLLWFAAWFLMSCSIPDKQKRLSTPEKTFACREPSDYIYRQYD